MGSSASTSGIPESRTVLGQREGWSWAEQGVSGSGPCAAQGGGRARREGVPSGHSLGRVEHCSAQGRLQELRLGLHGGVGSGSSGAPTRAASPWAGRCCLATGFVRLPAG